MARLSNDGLSSSWTPAKLVDVLNQFMPGVAPQLLDAVDALAQLTDPNAAGKLPDESRLHAALIVYAAGIGGADPVEPHRPEEAALVAADVHAREPVGTGTTQIAPPLTVPGHDLADAAVGDVGLVRELFAKITDELDARTGIKLDRKIARELRAECLDRAGLNADGTPVRGGDEKAHERRPAPEALLDTEIVAIYW